MKALSPTKLTFKRVEKKYILSATKYAEFMNVAKDHLIPDEFHKSHVMSIYYDRPDYHYIRLSVDGPVFKEKIRIRSYGVPKKDGTVFVELKRKYAGVVFKRRVGTTPENAEKWLAGQGDAPFDNQITREINWFLKNNRIEPKIFIGAERTSWIDKENSTTRITFDSSIKCRETDLSLTMGGDGEELLEDGSVLMEVKIADAAPLWLAHTLSELKIFPTSFSKYGTYYKKEVIKRRI